MKPGNAQPVGGRLDPPVLVVVGVDTLGNEVARLVLGHGEDPAALLASHGWEARRTRDVTNQTVTKPVLTMTFQVVPNPQVSPRFRPAPPACGRPRPRGHLPQRRFPAYPRHPPLPRFVGGRSRSNLRRAMHSIGRLFLKLGLERIEHLGERAAQPRAHPRVTLESQLGHRHPPAGP